MWTNGSRSARSTWEKARRTGKPSPSRPLRAIVRLLTGRSRATVGSGSGMRCRTVTSSTVIAGMGLVSILGVATAELVAQSTIFVNDDPRPRPCRRVVQPDAGAQVDVVTNDVDRLLFAGHAEDQQRRLEVE